MEYFLEQIKLIMPVLGFDFLRPSPTRDNAIGMLKRSTLLLSECV